VADQVKAFLPAIRNNILMVLAHKTSTELLEREGKAKLAKDIARETERALGMEPEEEEGEAEEENPKKKGKKKKKAAVEHLVSQVHFGNFIVQ
jgi:flagellar protein FliL